MLDDDNPQKFRYKGQTEIKHRLLSKYLNPWFNKIATQSREVHYIDGFAGPGIYPDGSEGSPLIAMEVADTKLADHGLDLDAVKVLAVEKNNDNYENLAEAIANKQTEVHPAIDADPVHGEFGTEAVEYICEYQNDPEPCFIFIDPFGFSGVPLEVVSSLMNLRDTGIEVFITFMAGKMAQYLGSEQHEAAMDTMFGTEDWREAVDYDAGKETRAEQLMLYYERRLRREADIRHVWPFQMYEESKTQTAYYLIHATNHFEGFQLMKDTMFSSGADGEFAYLGPDHYRYEDEQMDLSSFEGVNQKQDASIAKIQEILLETYDGKQPRFRTIVRDLYVRTPYIKSQMRQAIKELAKGAGVRIHNYPDRPDGNHYGLGLDDEVEFTGQTQASLGSY